MMLVAVLLLAQEPPPDCRTLAGCEATGKATVGTWDVDGDRRLSRAEWDRMGETLLSRIGGQPTPDNLTQIRKDIAADFHWEDANGDGYVTSEEMLKARKDAFSCMDGDGDGRISDEEQSAGEVKCKPW
jgi:hypothetical protein